MAWFALAVIPGGVARKNQAKGSNLKLTIPYLKQIKLDDQRLIRLAEFCGVQCQLLPLKTGVGADAAASYLKETAGASRLGLLLNPAVFEEWLRVDRFPPELSHGIRRSFPKVLIHNLYPHTFHDSVVETISDGQITSICPVDAPAVGYRVSSESSCSGPFSGIRFGPASPSNDSVMRRQAEANLEEIITIGEFPYCAKLTREHSTVFFIAGRNTVDLSMNVAKKPLVEYFSQLVPLIIFLREAFAESCWKPSGNHATLIVDDPLLWARYGCLRFDQLLELMDSHNFHTSIAFIPHNYNRSSPKVAKMFRERSDRLSICFHGNDHTRSEFATSDERLLDAMLKSARSRMEQHYITTGIAADNVMVFPRGEFSREAMTALSDNSFSAAINSGPTPVGESPTVPLSELLKPAVTTFGDCPLFLRQYSRNIKLHDIAFNFFVGKPLFIVEHHQTFDAPDSLLSVVADINRSAPTVKWCSVQSAIQESYHWRIEKNVLRVLAFSKWTRIENPTDTETQCSCIWPQLSYPQLQTLIVEGRAANEEVPHSNELQFALPGRGICQISARSQERTSAESANLDLLWRVNAFLLRRMSELRDNIVSQSTKTFSGTRFRTGLLNKIDSNPVSAESKQVADQSRGEK